MPSSKPSNIVGLKELRENIDTYIGLIDQGMKLTVVRRSKPIFNITPVGEMADDQWETVVDFTKLQRGGVDINDLLKRL